MRCVRGHCRWGFHEFFQGDYKYLTFLRDPVDRVVSLYYQIVNTPWHFLHDDVAGTRMTLCDFVASDVSEEISNDQVRRLAGLGSGPVNGGHLDRAWQNVVGGYCFAGVSELFDLSLMLLKQQFPGWRLNYVKRNVRRQSAVDSGVDEVRDIIRVRNEYDQQLYERVRSQLEYDAEQAKRQIQSALPAFIERNRILAIREERFAGPLRLARKTRNKLRRLQVLP